MVTWALLQIALGIGCLWVFVGTTVRADTRAGGAQTRISRRSGVWLLAAIVDVVFGVGLLVAHVVGL